jgi:hypothetical protein
LRRRLLLVYNASARRIHDRVNLLTDLNPQQR